MTASKKVYIQTLFNMFHYFHFSDILTATQQQCWAIITINFFVTEMHYEVVLGLSYQVLALPDGAAQIRVAMSIGDCQEVI